MTNDTLCWNQIEEAISRGADVSASLESRVPRVVDALQALVSDESSEFLRRFLATSVDTNLVRAAAGQISRSMATIADLAMAAGMTPASAHKYAADWLATLQGALVLHAFLGETGPFSRTLQRLLDLKNGAIDAT